MEFNLGGLVWRVRFGVVVILAVLLSVPPRSRSA